MVRSQEDSLGMHLEVETDSQEPWGSPAVAAGIRGDTPAGQEVGRSRVGSQDAAEGRAVG